MTFDLWPSHTIGRTKNPTQPQTPSAYPRRRAPSTPPRPRPLRRRARADLAAPAPSRMAEPTYKVPDDFNLGIFHHQVRNGVIITYRDGNVAKLQKDLISGYNHLAYAYKNFREAQAWLDQVPDRVETCYMESRRDKYLELLRTEREGVVDLMCQILKAGAEPLPPVSQLDGDVALALGTGGLLREAAIAAAGGQESVEGFRLAAVNFVTEAITRTSPILMADAQEFLMNQQQRAAQRAVEAQEIADNEAQVFAQGPSAAAVRRFKDGERRNQEALKDAELRRKQGLEKLKAKLKAAKEKQQRRP